MKLNIILNLSVISMIIKLNVLKNKYRKYKKNYKKKNEAKLVFFKQIEKLK